MPQKESRKRWPGRDDDDSEHCLAQTSTQWAKRQMGAGFLEQGLGANSCRSVQRTLTHIGSYHDKGNLDWLARDGGDAEWDTGECNPFEGRGLGLGWRELGGLGKGRYQGDNPSGGEQKPSTRVDLELVAAGVGPRDAVAQRGFVVHIRVVCGGQLERRGHPRRWGVGREQVTWWMLQKDFGMSILAPAVPFIYTRNSVQEGLRVG
jgi:hypothetical protein